jgi:hypothetical protein
MATRKKQQRINRIGLLSGPSRKQVTFENPATPVEISRAQNLLFKNAAAAATSQTTVYTCPQGKRARIVFFNHYASAGCASQLLISSISGTKQIMYNHRARLATDANVFSSFDYQTAPTIFENEYVYIDAALAGSSRCNLHIVEEQA